MGVNYSLMNCRWHATPATCRGAMIVDHQRSRWRPSVEQADLCSSKLSSLTYLLCSLPPPPPPASSSSPSPSLFSQGRLQTNCSSGPSDDIAKFPPRIRQQRYFASQFQTQSLRQPWVANQREESQANARFANRRKVLLKSAAAALSSRERRWLVAALDQ